MKGGVGLLIGSTVRSLTGLAARLPGRGHLVLAGALAGLLAGAVLWLAGQPGSADRLWAATVVLAIVPLGFSVARDLLHRKTGVDLIALLAMAGSLLLGQYLAGAVVGLMLSGGLALEKYASARARRELSALLARAPRSVSLYRDGGLVTVDVAAVREGDRLLVKPGEVVAVDGLVSGGTAVLDESALTGESRPVERSAGDTVQSGVVNGGPPFDMRALKTAEHSTYAAIVRLVRDAQSSKAPFVRLADRYALWFLPITLGVAGIAWAVSGSPVRALAVLVVATPCPLILAAPVAIVAGISRAASRGIIVKGGGALETLARARTLVFDKTGTLTTGTPRVSAVESFGALSEDELVRLAASLDQVSPHVFASAIVTEARSRNLSLDFPSAVEEHAGSGIRGEVGGTRVALGQARWLASHSPMPAAAAGLRRRTEVEGLSSVFIAVDGEIAGAMVVEDSVRADTPHAIQMLRRSGIRRIVLLTGDREEVARSVGASLGADSVLWERSPREKVESVLAEGRSAVTVMVGDGVNDAPALAAADVGIAMGARGATASSEAADAVIVVDRLDRVAEAIGIARRARGIAVQSVLAGMGLSAVGMVLAAFGWLPPVAGAVFQEAIDVAVILNALRALQGVDARRALPGETAIQELFSGQHRELLPLVDSVRGLADRIGEIPGPDLKSELQLLARALNAQLLPHEKAEGETMYPMVERLLGGRGATGTMSRAHAEIERLVAALGRITRDLPVAGPGPEDLRELRRVLYGLHAVLRLHFAQEEESYLSLLSSPESELSAARRWARPA